MSCRQAISAAQLDRAASPDALTAHLRDRVERELYAAGARPGSVRVAWEVDVRLPGGKIDRVNWSPDAPLPDRAKLVHCVGRGSPGEINSTL